jgi:hypothetical protein
MVTDAAPAPPGPSISRDDGRARTIGVFIEIDRSAVRGAVAAPSAGDTQQLPRLHAYRAVLWRSGTGSQLRLAVAARSGPRAATLRIVFEILVRRVGDRLKPRPAIRAWAARRCGTPRSIQLPRWANFPPRFQLEFTFGITSQACGLCIRGQPDPGTGWRQDERDRRARVGAQASGFRPFGGGGPCVGCHPRWPLARRPGKHRH